MNWTNVNNSIVYSAASINTIKALEIQNVIQGIIYGGDFEYLNEESNKIFGNIIYYDLINVEWRSIGSGCNGPVISVDIFNPGQCEDTSCLTLVVAGDFNACLQVSFYINFFLH